MTRGETLNCHVDKEVVALVDRWRFEHPTQPSRRIAVRQLLKMALKGLDRQKQETAWAWREIIRPHYGKPYLGKLGEIHRTDIAAGRYLDLLPSAHASSPARCN
jgi:hypothetical protein